MPTSSSIVVIKIGGSTLGSHDTSLADAAYLNRQGVQLVLIHGGGSTITEYMARLGIQTEFVQGLRVTDEASLEVVTAVLAGVINKQLVVSLQALGVSAIGISGVDGGLIEGDLQDPRLGFVAGTIRVDIGPIKLLLEAGYVPVIAPLALFRPTSKGSTYHLLNVNADTVAGSIAVALQASQLVFLTDVDGVLDTDGHVIPCMSGQQGYALLDSGVISGGMIPKLKASLHAASQGIPSWLVNGTRASALLEGVNGTGRGTRVL